MFWEATMHLSAVLNILMQLVIASLHPCVPVLSCLYLVSYYTTSTLYHPLSSFLGQVVSGSWDKTLKCWDPRGASGQERTLVGTYNQLQRVYSLSVNGHRLVAATAGRHVNIYDLRNMSQPEQTRESSLKYQTRCVRCYPNQTGLPLFYPSYYFPYFSNYYTNISHVPVSC